MLTHVVIFWTDKGAEEKQRLLLEGAAKLDSIPGVQNFRVGKPVPSQRGVVDDTFAVAISMDFEDEEALAAYAVHPDHQAFVADVLKPNAVRFLVYDFAD